MEENRKTSDKKIVWIEILLTVFSVLLMWLLCTGKSQPAELLLRNCMMTLLLIGICLYHIRREFLFGKLDYNNSDHSLRFFMCFSIGVIISFASGFLPEAGWPYLLIYVMLTLYSNLSIGVVTATSLLLITTLLNGGNVSFFCLYFVSGIFASVLFHSLDEDFQFKTPLFLSVFCLLVCETANIIITTNAHPDLEMFVIPVSNMIVSSILLIGFLKLFSLSVVFCNREKYLEINDTEAAELVKLKEENKRDYMLSIHTVYFCERIADRLCLCKDALKTAGYYHRIGESITEIMSENKFPAPACSIILEYQKRKTGIYHKETAVLLCSDIVISAIMYMIEKSENKKIDYDKVIDTLFDKILTDGTLEHCDISMNEILTMKNTFKEEKLYYDFLH